jgi:transposase
LNREIHIEGGSMTYFGIDVASATLEVGSPATRNTLCFPNTGAGVSALIRWFENQSCAHAIVEPTSTYHQHLIRALAEHDIPYTLINPARTAAFARLQGNRAKTDAVDARTLAALGESQQPKATPPPDEEQEQLKALRRHLEWLEAEQRAAQNRLDTARRSPWTPQAVLESLERTLRALEQERERLEEAIAAKVEEHPDLHQSVSLLTSVPGVGERTAVLLLSELPSVNRASSAKTWVAFCGVNPEPRDSGKTHFSRLSRVGVARVRAALYMAAVSALRWNPAVRALGARLSARGKRGKLRVMAAMNKLLRLCFGVLKHGRPFNPALVSHASA